MKRSLLDFLQDILDATAEIEGFIAEIDFDAFDANREKTLAVVKLLEVIGEAVKQIPQERRSLYSEIPWRSIAGMKDVFVHEYWGIDTAVVWSTVQESLPVLKVAILDMLSSLSNEVGA
jgi:uncharacterized protein with HEPN domain